MIFDTLKLTLFLIPISYTVKGFLKNILFFSLSFCMSVSLSLHLSLTHAYFSVSIFSSFLIPENYTFLVLSFFISVSESLFLLSLSPLISVSLSVSLSFLLFFCHSASLCLFSLSDSVFFCHSHRLYLLLSKSQVVSRVFLRNEMPAFVFMMLQITLEKGKFSFSKKKSK